MNETDTKVFGFWVYLMTDLVIFAVLFAAYIVLQGSTFGGPTAQQLYNMPSAFAETLILLTSSFTCALATLSMHRQQKKWTIFWFAVTFLLGLAFLIFELTEFHHFIEQGASWQTSAFLSSFFALVGTHGLHISIGLLWMLFAILYTSYRGLIPSNTSKLMRLAYFWHFLDVVWVFIFTIVYGMGHLQ